MIREEKSREEVLAFINKRFKTKAHWNITNCYYFSVILQNRFPGGTICYLPRTGYFAYRYMGRYYDAEGEVFPHEVMTIMDITLENKELVDKYFL